MNLSRYNLNSDKPVPLKMHLVRPGLTRVPVSVCGQSVTATATSDLKMVNCKKCLGIARKKSPKHVH